MTLLRVSRKHLIVISGYKFNAMLNILEWIPNVKSEIKVLNYSACKNIVSDVISFKLKAYHTISYK